MAKPIVYGPALSTYVRTVRLALTEKGVDYDLVPVDLFAGEGQRPEHLARHPWGKVPAFAHDGFTLYETAAITRYVDEAFPGPALQPAEAHARARMTQAIAVIDCYAYQPIAHGVVIPRFMHAKAGAPLDEAALAKAAEAGAKGLDALAQILDGHPWLAGPNPSLADLHLAPLVYYYAGMPEGQAYLAKVTPLAEWWERMRARPSMAPTEPKP